MVSPDPSLLPFPQDLPAFPSRRPDRAAVLQRQDSQRLELAAGEGGAGMDGGARWGEQGGVDSRPGGPENGVLGLVAETGGVGGGFGRLGKFFWGG